MLLNILRQFNWLDIFVVIFLLRIIYIAARSGLPVEIFKLLGVLVAVYISLHYYTLLSDRILGFFAAGKEKVPLEFADFVSFVVLAVAGYMVFVLLRSVFCKFIKMEAVANLNRFGGLILGLFRAYLLLGLIMFAMAISSVSYMEKSVKESYMGGHLFQVAPNTYSWLWDNLASKFMGTEKFNKTVSEIQGGFIKK